MDQKKDTPKDIDNYISRYPPEIQEILQNIRLTIKQAVPGAEEVISYQIPAFRYAGYMLIFFAGQENHVGLYPVPIEKMDFLPEVSQYASGKATLKFPYQQPIPYDLITRIVQLRAQENMMKSAR